MITQERLKELLHYNPDTGEFTRLVTVGGKLKGTIAGNKKLDGYYGIKIDRKTYYIHRLAWLYMYGFIPKEIDHININKADNRIDNLRIVTRATNCQNLINPSKNNKLGLLGVHFRKDSKKYRATFTSDGVTHNVGSFLNANDAYEAIVNKKRSLNNGFTG